MEVTVYLWTTMYKYNRDIHFPIFAPIRLPLCPNPCAAAKFLFAKEKKKWFSDVSMVQENICLPQRVSPAANGGGDGGVYFECLDESQTADHFVPKWNVWTMYDEIRNLLPTEIILYWWYHTGMLPPYCSHHSKISKFLPPFPLTDSGELSMVRCAGNGEKRHPSTPRFVMWYVKPGEDSRHETGKDGVEIISVFESAQLLQV